MSYTTDISVDSVQLPQEYIALRLTKTMNSFDDVYLVNAAYDTRVRLLEALFREAEEPKRLNASGVYVLCACSVHGKAMLWDYTRKAVHWIWGDRPPVEPPLHIAVSIFGNHGTTRMQFIEVPHDFVAPHHCGRDCFHL